MNYGNTLHARIELYRAINKLPHDVYISQELSVGVFFLSRACIWLWLFRVQSSAALTTPHDYCCGKTCFFRAKYRSAALALDDLTTNDETIFFFFFHITLFTLLSVHSVGFHYCRTYCVSFYSTYAFCQFFDIHLKYIDLFFNISMPRTHIRDFNKSLCTNRLPAWDQISGLLAKISTIAGIDGVSKRNLTIQCTFAYKIYVHDISAQLMCTKCSHLLLTQQVAMQWVTRTYRHSVPPPFFSWFWCSGSIPEYQSFNQSRRSAIRFTRWSI